MGTRPVREKQVRRRVRDRLERTFGTRVWLYPTTNTGYGKAGAPDLLGCLEGFFFAVECKRDRSHRPTALQAHVMEQIEEAKGKAFVVCDEESMDELTYELARRVEAIEALRREVTIHGMVEGGGDES